MERLRQLELTNAALQEELRKTPEVGEERYRHNRHTARREAEEVAPLPPPHPPTRGDPEPPGPRLFGTHSRRATAWGGAQGGSGSNPPSWIPNRGVQVEPVQSDTEVDIVASRGVVRLERWDWCPPRGVGAKSYSVHWLHCVYTGLVVP